MVHCAELVERHDITLPLNGRDVNAVTGQCRLAAEQWAQAQGLALSDVTALSSSRARNGVTFTVTVGKGNISLDQSSPGVLDNWRWSGPRLDWWRAIFNRRDGRQGRILTQREDGLASVTALFRSGRSGRENLPIYEAPGFVPPTPSWSPAPPVPPVLVEAGPGCLCGLGDDSNGTVCCPVHGA